MSFLIKTPVIKGSPTTVTLVKSSLAILPAIASDIYFSDLTNWKKVSVLYKNTQDQKKTLVFDATLESPASIFSASLSARDGFNIKSVIIYDFDGGTKEVVISEIPALDLADMSITFAPVVSNSLISETEVGVFITTESGDYIVLDN